MVKYKKLFTINNSKVASAEIHKAKFKIPKGMWTKEVKIINK